MTAAQVAANSAAALWLAERLSLWGLTEATDRAEFVCRELLALGMRPVEPPVPVRSGATSTKAGRKRAREIYEQTRREKAEKETAK